MTVRRAALVVSALGHPLCTTAMFLICLSMRATTHVSVVQAAAILATVVAPVALWNVRQVRAGHYADLDVSVRTERRSMYVVMVGLMSIATLLIWFSHVGASIRLGMTCLLGVFVAAAAANAWIKVSLHAAVSFFLAVSTFLIHPVAGAAMLGLAAAVAVSRLIVGRHTVPEVIAGTAIGLAGAAVLVALVGTLT